ncbi:MAG TPA: threonine/serine dehydratase [Casimicrobiaceae bacterium]|jgi:threonine dehydratase|nr:threonine/serine dehydratase [Casimicrobiaceae bacterium]
MPAPNLADIRAAHARVAPRIHRTPLLSATRLGARAGVTLFHKCESLQKTGSFKVRGALNNVSQLDAAARRRGVITVSAGNHAQALAWAARDAAVRCTVVMPTTASQMKVEASRGYGADVVLHGASGIEAFAHAHELAKERDLTFVHPFDDSAVIAGQGTVGLEILEQLQDVDDVIVPIGGGGLIAGVATAIKESRPSVRVFGVEPTGAAVMRKSLDAGRPVRLESMKTIADGLAAPMAGDVTYPIVKHYVDDVVLVTDDEIMQAMREILFSAKLLAEGGGAAATAAILSGKLKLDGRRVVAVLSGGNVDPTRVQEVLRAEG